MGDQKFCKGYYFQVEPIYVYFDQSLFDKAYQNYKTATKKLSNIGTTIDQFDINDNYIKTYNSIIEAAEKTYGTIHSRRIIKQCLDNKRENFKNYK